MAPYSVQQISQLLRESDNAPTNDEKGDKLEQLARYLFEEMGLHFERKNILNRARSLEFDLVFSNRTAIQFFDYIIFVECKNTVRRTTSSDVRLFAHKLQSRGVKCAVLVTLSGLTGNAQTQSHAHNVIREAMERNGLRILVVSREEILQLRDSDDLMDLLSAKYIDLTLM